MNNFGNLFKEKFISNYSFGIYKKYAWKYLQSMGAKYTYNELSQDQLDLIKKCFASKNIGDIQKGLLQTQGVLNKIEKNDYYSNDELNRTTNEILDVKKYKEAIRHYDCFFVVQQKYNKLKNIIDTKSSPQSNIVPVAQFHQGITHLSRFMNYNNREKEVYRFDSHIIRGTFDTQKLIIESIRNELKNKKIDEKNILREYINVKNQEVPGKNMSKFDLIFDTYNKTIESFSNYLNDNKKR